MARPDGSSAGIGAVFLAAGSSSFACYKVAADAALHHIDSVRRALGIPWGNVAATVIFFACLLAPRKYFEAIPDHRDDDGENDEFGN